MSDNPLGLPYSPHTRQVQGRKSEKARAKDYGARLHPMSGAGRIKDDASNDEAVFEFKDANRTHTLKSAELRPLIRRAIQQGKDARYVVTFTDGVVADVHLYTTQMKGPLND